MSLTHTKFNHLCYKSHSYKVKFKEQYSIILYYRYVLYLLLIFWSMNDVYSYNVKVMLSGLLGLD